MLAPAKQHAPVEVGTSLIGRYVDNGWRAVVVGLAPLPSNSEGSRNQFYRGVKGLREFYLKLFQRFHRQRHYVGEWHNHPDGAPTPSSTDRLNQSAIAVDQKTDCPEAVLIILGGQLSSNPALAVFIHSRTHGLIALSPSRS
jgi:integrative and conjugative element protein (TIGR02256 family)